MTGCNNRGLMNCNILIVTVLFNQQIKHTNVFRTLLGGYEDVYIYDNSAVAQISGQIPSKWVYVSDPSNPGLSTAYNKAAEYAHGHGYDWLLICDQDTIFPKNSIKTCLSHIQKHPGYNLFVPRIMADNSKYMSPIRIRNYVTKLSDSVPSGRIDLDKYAVINSGMLVNTGAFLKCGGYNENVFLDFSDFQFIEKFSRLYPDAFVMDMTCKQNFSNLTDSTESKLNRFRLFCKSLYGYESLHRFGKHKITLIVIKRTLSLCLQSRSFKPLSIFFKTYF